MSVAASTMRGPGGRVLTEEQADAVRRRSGPLLLAANAGSGKTSVLVERFVRTVAEDGIAPESILAITFTEKAAGELRSRVRERLLERGDRESARAIERAWISTVHAFCLRLLRAHAVTAGLDPDFQILDESTARDLRTEAWRGALAAFLDEDGLGALDLTATYGPDKLLEEISAAHDQLRSAGQTHPRLPEPDLPAVPDRTPLMLAHAAATTDLADAKDNKLVLAARRALAACGEMLAVPDPVDGPSAAALAVAAFKAGNAKALQSDDCTRYLDVLKVYTAAWQDRRAAGAIALFDALLQRYATAYASAKTAASALDFDDLELRARDLLRDHVAIRARYAERFARVMVDEFQDSNPLQTELFGLLTADSGELVVVGDERQSIYGFRHADVEVFRARRAVLAPQDGVAILSANFRSDPAILEAVNVAFAPIFGEDFTPLRAGRGDALATDGPKVELLLTDAPAWGSEEADGVALGELPAAARWRHAEARLLAQRIAELVADGTSPQDVVVLVRGLGDLPVYERAIEDRGLSVLATGGRGYWGRQVVLDLCGWLAALANPRDELALYGVLASPLVGLSSDGLWIVAKAARGHGLWPSIEAGEAVAQLDDDDRDRLQRFAARFAHERTLLAHVSLETLLERVIVAADYDLHVLSLPGGARRLANVHKLLRLAAAQAGVGADVRAFADHAKSELDADARESDAPVELSGTSAIRVMTIHAAKGLEFPVVCVADLGRLKRNQLGDLLVADDRVGLRLRSLDGPAVNALDYDALKRDQQAADGAEEERIAYVAMTRAERRLILSGGLAVDKWPDPNGAGAAPLAWLGLALAPGLRAGALTDDAPVADLEHTAGEHRAVVRCSLNRPATVGRVLRTEGLAPGGERLPPARPAGVRAPAPPREPAAPPAASLSYSAISQHQQCGYRFYLQRVLRLPERREDRELAVRAAPAGALDPRARGSIVHALLEDLDVAHPAPWDAGGDPAARAELVRTAAERAGVEPDDEHVEEMAGLVTGFAASPLARRMAKAKRLHREHTFSLPLDGTLVNGIVDVVAQERDGWLVVDYKTDRLPDDLDRESYLEARYHVQRDTYALAALRAGAAKVCVAYVLLDRPGEPITTEFTADDTDALAERLRVSARPLMEGDARVAEVPHRDLCLGCPGRGGLCPQPVELTLREFPGSRPDAA
ncbi:MAG: UvrD-helicase domain-containing protein [Solirubrobacteraceae bacterium]|nr:UvrD-helicase domain-containing protein [Solirubrobacteraceae bacterium]